MQAGDDVKAVYLTLYYTAVAVHHQFQGKRNFMVDEKARKPLFKQWEAPTVFCTNKTSTPHLYFQYRSLSSAALRDPYGPPSLKNESTAYEIR